MAPTMYPQRIALWSVNTMVKRIGMATDSAMMPEIRPSRT